MVHNLYGITLGKIYEVVEKVPWHDGHHTHYYKITNDYGNVYAYWPEYFEEVADNLPEGWKYCKCGTLTTDSFFCCECRGKNYR